MGSASAYAQSLASKVPEADESESARGSPLRVGSIERELRICIQEMGAELQENLKDELSSFYTKIAADLHVGGVLTFQGCPRDPWGLHSELQVLRAKSELEEFGWAKPAPVQNIPEVHNIPQEFELVEDGLLPPAA